MRRLGIANFRNVSKPGFVEMSIQRRKKFLASFRFRFGCVAANAHPSLDKCADEPGPNCPLVINRVTLARASVIMRRVARFARRKGSQTDGSDQ